MFFLVYNGNEIASIYIYIYIYDMFDEVVAFVLLGYWSKECLGNV